MDRVLFTRKNLVKFKYEVLLLFVFLEVLLYDKLEYIQITVSVVEYLFLLFCIVINKRVGTMYLISFTLLSLGSWSYITQETLPYNFWGIRVFELSVNIIFTMLVSFYLLVANRFKVKKIFIRPGNKFFIVFIFHSILVGAVFVSLSMNYLDNFLNDLQVYVPYFFYLYLLSLLSVTDLRLVVKYAISLTVITMMLSFITNQLFEYGGGYKFVLMNSFTFIIVFTLFFFRNLFSRNQFYLLFASVLFLLVSGKVFMGSKSIILILLLILWLAFSSWKILAYTILIIISFLFIMSPIVDWVLNNFSNDLMVSYKFTQILNVFELVDIKTIAESRTSMGNIVAEAVTIMNYMIQHPLFFLTGKGFGGGVTDTNGYLSDYVGAGMGYADIELVRNQFRRMHLPLFEIVVKAGVIGVFLYLRLLIKTFRKKDIYSFSFFIIIMMVLSNSKEMLLLCMLFDYLSNNIKEGRLQLDSGPSTLT